jgi:hypothetical protein
MQTNPRWAVGWSIRMTTGYVKMMGRPPFSAAEAGSPRESLAGDDLARLLDRICQKTLPARTAA